MTYACVINIIIRHIRVNVKKKIITIDKFGTVTYYILLSINNGYKDYKYIVQNISYIYMC